MNPRVTKKDRELLQGALRRVFSRSELRKVALDAVKVDHSDPDRPRVKKWGKCPICLIISPLYKFQVDHIDPVVPLDKSYHSMGLDETVDRMWCEQKGLQGICESCHNEKSQAERKIRNSNKPKKPKKVKEKK